MKIIQKLVVFSIFASLVLITMRGSYGCAVMVPPTGGPKDTLPPKLLNALPINFKTNFTGNRIVFNFDEYVDLDNVQQNLLVSPVPKINPVVERKLRTVTIKLKDTLLKNTTYTFEFGRSIKDVNEGNVLKNFSYIFSTGPYIDSLDLGGKVILAQTGGKDSTLIVILHKKLDDSAVVNDRPRYVTRVDSTGAFMFHHLAPGTYNIFALKDESGLRRYFSRSQLFAFNDKPVIVQQVNEPITLYAYSEEEVKKPTTKPAAASKKEEKEKDKRLVVETNLSNKQLDLLDSFKIHFKTRLVTFDSTKVHFKDGMFNDISNYSLIEDSTGRKFTLITKWAPDSPYHLILEKDFGEDSLGRKLLKADTIAFRTKKESDYGSVRIRFRNLDMNKNPVIQFVQNNEVKFSAPLTKPEFSSKLFVPGEYHLRMLYDDDKNGVWTPGDFFEKHIQPEIVVRIPINNKKKLFTVKANWENDLDITL